MDLLTAFTAFGLLLVAIGISGRRYSAWAVLGGLCVVVLSGLGRLLSGDGFIESAVALFRDAGLAFLLAAVWLSLRKPRPGARSFFLLGAMSLVIAGVLFVAGQVLGGRQSTVSILVELGPDDHVEEIVSTLTRYGAEAEQAFPTVTLADDEDLAQVYLVHVAADDAADLTAALAADAENVDFVEDNTDVELPPVVYGTPVASRAPALLEDDPHAAEQWALDTIRGHEAHALLHTAAPQRKARVAILDTGIEGDHEDLASVLVTRGANDAHGHGTHCAGIAGAATNNGLGIASLNWDGAFIELLAFEALGDGGRGSLERIAQAIIDATQAGADVISMSLGSAAKLPPQVLVNAVNYALRNNVVVVASAGNSNEDAANHFPSNIEGVIAVAAVDQALEKAPFSNTVGSLTRPLAAPGVDILSSHLHSSYQPLSGTSMATPLVAGVLGVMRAIDPGLSAASAYRILHETGTVVPATPQVGRVLNAEAALQALRAL